MLHSAFYQFFELADPEAFAEQLRAQSQALPTVGGLILLAKEGINGVMAGPEEDVRTFEQYLNQVEPMQGMVFKHSQCTTRPFGRMKIQCKKQIVVMGIDNVATTTYQPPQHTMLNPQQWRELIAQDDVVVIDNRNSFEYRLGHFAGAVDPGVRHFRDFPRYIEENLPQWKAQGKRIAMYCTGGIRCEKTAAWMDTLDQPVYQLDGGILNYFAALPDAQKDFHGECFVFDNRIAIDTQLKETDTTLEQVYQDELDGAWRIDRAQRLLALVQGAPVAPPPADE